MNNEERNSLIGATKSVVEEYKTADPFKIAEQLDIQVGYCDFGYHPLGKTIYDGKAPIGMLNQSIEHLPIRYFTMGHELRYIVLHDGLSAYYNGAFNGHGQFEHQADEFSVSLLNQLFIEENERLPEDYSELVNMYGLPMLN